MMKRLLLAAFLAVCCTAGALATVTVANTAVKSGTGTSLILTVPTPASGNELIALVRAGATPTPPAGWTQLVQAFGAGVSTVYYCPQSTCSGTSYTFGFGSSVSGIACYVELHGQAASPFELQTARNNGTSSTSVSTPTIHPNYLGEFTLSFMTASSGPTSFTDTGGYTAGVSDIVSGQACVMNYLSSAPASTFDSGTWGTSAAGQSGIIGIIPLGATRRCAAAIFLLGVSC